MDTGAAPHVANHSKHFPGATLGRLYPDIIIGPVNRPIAIIDAKYKPLADPRGVDREDLYQLNAYLAAYTTGPHTPVGALAFVHFPEQLAGAFAESRGPWRTEGGNQVKFVKMPVTETECVEALTTLVSVGQR